MLMETTSKGATNMREFSLRSVVAVSIALAAGFTFALPVKTMKNLEQAYTGETTATSKYTKYAHRARQEGKKGEAALFDAAAAGERIHARNHLRVLVANGITPKAGNYTGNVGGTSANVREALAGEEHERDFMYPAFIQAANDDAAIDAAHTFTLALATERRHAELFKDASARERNGWKVANITYYVCPTCGEMFAKAAPTACPVCGTERSKMFAVKER